MFESVSAIISPGFEISQISVYKFTVRRAEFRPSSVDTMGILHITVSCHGMAPSLAAESEITQQ